MISNATLCGIILGTVIVIVVISIFGVQISHFKRKINGAADYPYKHNLVIVAIFKNESWAMKEWLQHYVRQGVDHFYMIDNGSTDNWRPETEGFPVTIISDDSRPKPVASNLITNTFNIKPYSNQARLYNKYFLKVVKENARWVMVVDLDEFMYARKGKTIPEVLKEYDENVSQISVYWKIFGSNGHITQPPSIIQGFTRRKRMGTKDRGFAHVTPILDTFTKSIVKTIHLNKIDVHSAILYPFSYILYTRIQEPSVAIEENLHNANLHINHYIIQSYDRFKNIKMTRGDISRITYEKDLKTTKYFEHYDFNEIEDTELYTLYDLSDNPKEIAVVGNGPLTLEQMDEINTKDKVYRFNHVPKFRKGIDKIDALFFRNTYIFPLFKVFDKLVLKNNSRNLGAKFIAKNSDIAFEKIGILTDWNDKPVADKYIFHKDNREKFFTTCSYCQKGNCGLTSKPPSTGLIALQYLHKIYPHTKIHIYGMNWNFKQQKINSAHANNEENILRNCCSNCIIHPTNNNNYI